MKNREYENEMQATRKPSDSYRDSSDPSGHTSNQTPEQSEDQEEMDSV